MMSLLRRAWNLLRHMEWRFYKWRRRKRLKNHDFTILATNCIGTVIYHDLGLEFLSPTINLTISMSDLVKLAENPKWYMEQEFVELTDSGPCPAGMLGDIRVDFVHYASFAEGVQKWEERKRRINWNNIFLVGTDRNGCSYEALQSFDRLPYPNKVVFTRVEYPELASAYHMKGFEEEPELGVLTNFKEQIRIRRYMDDYDYVSFLNRAVKSGGDTG